MIKVHKSAIIAASKNRPETYIDDVMKHATIIAEDHIMLSKENWYKLRDKYGKPSINFKNIVLKEGPGYELYKLLGKLHLKPEKECKCAVRAALMNQWGPDICEKNIDTIVSWLKETAMSNNMPFSEIVAKAIVMRAISRSRKLKLSDPVQTTRLFYDKNKQLYSNSTDIDTKIIYYSWNKEEGKWYNTDNNDPLPKQEELPQGLFDGQIIEVIA